MGTKKSFVKRIVDTRFWSDDKIMELFTPEDKYFFLYLMTNRHSSQLGIYALNKKVMAFELGYSDDVVNALIDRFQNQYEIIKYSEQTREVAIKNYLRYSIVKGGKPVEDLLIKEISSIKDKSLLNFVYENIKKYNDLNETVRKILNLLKYDDTSHDTGHESSTNRTPMNNDYIISNNESNERVSLHDTSHDTGHESLKETPTLEEIEAYCRERHNTVNPQRFYDYYTANGWMVGKNPMQDWQAAIRRWETNGVDSSKASNKAPQGIVYEKYSEEYLNGLFDDVTEDDGNA